MQLFKGSYFGVAAGWRHLWPNVAIVNSATYVNYVWRVSKWNTKNHTVQRSLKYEMLATGI